MDGFDLELEIAKTDRALRELVDEAERTGLSEYLDKLLAEQQKRIREYFSEHNQDLSQLANPLNRST